MELPRTGIHTLIGKPYTGGASGTLYNTGVTVPPAEYIPTSGDGKGTVAFVDLEGIMKFGVNGSALSKSEINKDLRILLNEWHQKIKNNYTELPLTGDISQHLDEAFRHAEAMALIRAHQVKGSLPQKLTMYVDRLTCKRSCQRVLPSLVKELGVHELTIFSKMEVKLSLKI